MTRLLGDAETPGRGFEESRGPVVRQAVIRQEIDAVFDENAHLRAEVDRLRGMLRTFGVDPDQAA